jgi:hypothetical protein
MTNSNALLIGLIFCSIVIYYIYTYRKYNIKTDKELKNDKFNMLATNNQILSKYPKIVDFLFYFENYKQFSISQFEELKKKFELFCEIYEYCLIDNNLIFTNYIVLKDIKILITNLINSFIFNSYEMQYENIIIKQKIAAQKLLDDMLGKLVVLYKKNLYYNGYDINKYNVDYQNIIPFNALYDFNYREHYDKYNMEINYIF